jgi:hypothetical protein
MKSPNFLLCIVVVAASSLACGLSEDKYADQFLEKYCDEMAGCAEDYECLAGSDDADPDDLCAFDPELAKACLEASWECDDDLEIVVLPDVCLEVCGA